MPGKSPSLVGSIDNGGGVVRDTCHSLNGLPHELSACCIDNSYRKTPRRPAKIPHSENKNGSKTNSSETIVQLQGPRYSIAPYPWSSSPLLDEVTDNSLSDVNASSQDPHGPCQVPLDLGRVVLFPDGSLYCVRYFTRSEQNFLIPCDPDKAHFYSLLRLPCDVQLWDTAGEQLERVCVSRTASHTWSQAIASGHVPTVRTPVLASTSNVNLLDRTASKRFSYDVDSRNFQEPYLVSCELRDSDKQIKTEDGSQNLKKTPQFIIPPEEAIQDLCSVPGDHLDLVPTLSRVSTPKEKTPSNILTESNTLDKEYGALSNLKQEATRSCQDFPRVTNAVQLDESCPAWTHCSLNKILDSGFSSLECCGGVRVFGDKQKEGTAGGRELILKGEYDISGERGIMCMEQVHSDCLPSWCEEKDCKGDIDDEPIGDEFLEEDGAPDNSRLERSCRRSLNFGVTSEDVTPEQLPISPSLLYCMADSSSECESCHDTTDSLSYELDDWSSDDQDEESLERPSANPWALGQSQQIMEKPIVESLQEGVDFACHVLENASSTKGHIEGPFKNYMRRTTASQSCPRLVDGRELSFEGNQSFPRARQVTSSSSLVSVKDRIHTDLRNITDLVNDIKVVPRNRRSLYGASTLDRYSSFLDRSTLEGKDPGDKSADKIGQQNSTVSLVEILPQFDICPHLKGSPSLAEILFNSVTSCICVINPARNGKIVSINEQFQLLIGIHEKVVGQKFFRFIKIRGDSLSLKKCCPKPFVLSNRRPVSVSGKLVWCRVSSGQEYPLSLWVAPLDVNPALTICVLDHTYSLPTSEVTRIGYMSMSVDCLEAKRGQSKQRSVPLTSKEDSQELDVFMNMESLVILDSGGKISVHDPTFWSIHFGYIRAPIQLNDVLRDVCSLDKDAPDASRSDEALRCSSETALGDTPQLSISYLPECSQPQTPVSLRGQTDKAIHLELHTHCFAERRECDSDGETDEHLQFPGAHMYTSTPHKQMSRTGNAHALALDNGVYTGSILHHDGSKVAITFKVGTLVCQCPDQGHRRFCVWICPRRRQDWWSHCGPNTGWRVCGSEKDADSGDDIDDDKGGKVEVLQSYNSGDTHSGSDDTDQCLSEEELTTSCYDPVDPSLGQLVLRQAALNRSDNASMAEDKLDLDLALDEWLAGRYVTLNGLGQGSYGFVRRALRVGCSKEDTVVIKFIRKSKMHPNGWVEDVKARQRVPLEVAILSEISDKSKYIIKLHEYHINENFVQLVMEDFGKMDLFDFIDHVEIDECVAKHIFVQVLKGVDFLANAHILHRDIKDENVVINERYECKLIDFGSAAYMLPEGEWFEEFRGTKEYCSPEVWQGDRYRGPEQEMWALGVMLFTVMFAVNPYTANELPYQMTVDDLPFPTSTDMSNLLLHLLECEPQKRMTLEGALTHPWCASPLDISLYRWQNVFGNEDHVDDLRCSSKSLLLCEPTDQGEGHKWTHELG